MSEIKKSILAQVILECAENLRAKYGAKTLSAEGVYCAAITIGFAEKGITENENSGIDAEELRRMNELLYKQNNDVLAVMGNLCRFMEKDETAPYITSLIFNKLMMKADMRAEAAGSDITADILIQCILDEPPRGIRYCVVEGRTYPLNAQSAEASGGSAESNPAEGSGKERIKSLISKTKEIRNTLLESVFGQDNAINVFTTGYFQSELLAMTDKNRFRPKATFLFAGPPGVGKTFLAEKVAEVLELPFRRFDMSEYSDDEANIEFCGSDKVYKNGKAGNVTKFVEENPRCVILFDEIEKAHINVIHLFLQLLDAGRLRDNFTDNEVPFKDAIIILTTNAGRKLYENSEDGNFSGLSRKVILKALENDKKPNGDNLFPAAICSRFASGNVVMFNHMEAHNLRGIAKKEILRHAANMESEFGIKTEVDERVYSALMFAEGVAADARTIRSRAEAFYDGELFELFRLVDSVSSSGGVSGIESVKFTVELPENNPEITELFEMSEKAEILVFADNCPAEKFGAVSENCRLICVSDMDEAEKILKSRDIQLVICDPCCGCSDCAASSLNIEDIKSAGRDFFRYVRKKYINIPLYLLETKAHIFTAEERFSYTKEGARGVLSADGESLSEICGHIHQQQGMSKLAKANKVVAFETAQSISADGSEAQIRLFDFKMSVAVDPDDSKNMLSSISKPDVKFEQVIGANDAKEELKFFVDYLKNPKKFKGTGLRAPKGVLLYGPPGTGKTMLAKAMASESDVTFITAEGNQFLKKYIGEGSEAVHELFRKARKYAPAIVFIDEIDAIAKERKGGEHGAGSEDTLTAFLAEMDGFKKDSSKPVFVLAATNFDVEPGGDRSLDGALLRRFDRRVYIDLPDKAARRLYLQKKFSANAAFEVTEKKLDNISVRSVGMSLAQLESVCELALRAAVRTGVLKVTDEVFEEAFETFNSGESKKWDENQLRRVARHEAGHAFLCIHGGETPSYVTVVSRAGHGGYMQHSDNEGKMIYTKDELLAKIRTSLGGRAAEIVFYGEEDGASTGASGDLASATGTAADMICRYGMNEKFGLAAIDKRSASDEVRAAVNAILSEQMQSAIRAISENRKAVDALADELIAKNHLSGGEIEAFFASLEKTETGDRK